MMNPFNNMFYVEDICLIFRIDIGLGLPLLDLSYPPLDIIRCCVSDCSAKDIP